MNSCLISIENIISRLLQVLLCVGSENRVGCYLRDGVGVKQRRRSLWGPLKVYCSRITPKDNVKCFLKEKHSTNFKWAISAFINGAKKGNVIIAWEPWIIFTLIERPYEI